MLDEHTTPKDSTDVAIGTDEWGGKPGGVEGLGRREDEEELRRCFERIDLMQIN